MLKLATLLLSIFLLSGCGKKEEEKVASQVAAKVNADEITISQVDHLLSRAENLTPESLTKAKSDILERLIDQQLAKQRAIADKLDRTPAVVQAIESSRDEILARAYLEKVAAATPKPTADDVKKYYAAHPELFSERRVFSLEELVIDAREGLAAELNQRIPNARSLQDIAVWLQSSGIKFSLNRGVQAAEALPLELLPKLQALKDGDMQLVDNGNGRLNVFRIVASQVVPVDEEAAGSRIRQFLFNQTLNKALESEIKAIRDMSDIVYLGEFTGGAAVVEAKTRAEAEARALALAKTKSDADAQAQAEIEAKAKAEAETRAKVADLARARAEAAARREAGAEAKSPAPKPTQLRQDSIDKALGGLK